MNNEKIKQIWSMLHFLQWDLQTDAKMGPK